MRDPTVSQQTCDLGRTEADNPNPMTLAMLCRGEIEDVYVGPAELTGRLGPYDVGDPELATGHRASNTAQRARHDRLRMRTRSGLASRC
jgi:hypothetical protein